LSAFGFGVSKMKRKFDSKNKTKKPKIRKVEHQTLDFISLKKKELEEGYESLTESDGSNTSDSSTSSLEEATETEGSDTGSSEDDDTDSGTDFDDQEALDQVSLSDNSASDSDSDSSSENEFSTDDSAESSDSDEDMFFDHKPSTNKSDLLKQIHSEDLSSSAFDQISEELKNDKEIICALANHSMIPYEKIPTQFKEDVEVLMCLIEGGDRYLAKYIPPKFFEDKEFSLKALNSFVKLKYIPENLRQDVDIASAAIKGNVKNGKFLDPKFKCDPDFMIDAIKNFSTCYKYVDDSLKKDFNFNIRAIEANGDVLSHLPKNYQKDKFIVLKCIQRAPGSIHDINENFRTQLMADKEFVLDALKYNPFIVEHLPVNLSKDEVIALETLKREGDLIEFLPEAQKDKKMALIALQESPTSIQYFSEDLKRDKEIVLKFFQHIELSSADSELIEEVLIPFESDKEFLFEIVNSNNEVVEYFFENPETVKYLQEIMTKYPSSVYYLHSMDSPYLHNQVELDHSKLIKNALPKVNFSNLKPFIKKNGNFKLEKISDPNLMLQLLTLNGKFLDFLNHDLVTEEMRMVAYKHGKNITEDDDTTELSKEVLLHNLKKTGNVDTFLSKYRDQDGNLIYDDAIFECVELYPKSIRELEEEPIFSERKIEFVMRALKFINFCEKKFDHCECVDDFFVTGFSWRSPYSIRTDDKFLSIINKRRIFHFEMLENKKFSDVIIKHKK
jgi:hypothetical protein